MANFFEEDFGNRAKSLWGSGVEGATGLLSSGIHKAKKLGNVVGIGDESDSAFQFNTGQPVPVNPEAGGLYTPTTSFGGYGTEGAFSKAFQPSALPKTGLSSEGVGWEANKDKLDFDIPETYEGMKEKDKKEKKFDLQAFGQMLQSIKPEQQQQLSSSGRVGGSFRFDPSQYQNKLAQREFDQMYGAQPYTPHV